MSMLLKQHPDVCFSRPKEPHFFSRYDLTGLDDRELCDVASRYVRRFFEPRPGQHMLAEASPTYLYVPEQMEPIFRVWPDAKFIINVRNPLDMLPSLHARLLVTGDENVRDFATAWSLTSERVAGRRIPRSCIEPRWLRYDLAAAFGAQVAAFCEAVGRERCHIVLFDDLVGDPRGTYDKLCAFLGLEPYPGTEFRAERGHREVRNLMVQRLLNRPPVVLETLLASDQFLHRDGKQSRLRDKPLIKSLLKVRKVILKWNEVEARRQPLDPALKDEIAEHYRGEVERLGRFLNRDLSTWLDPVPSEDLAA